MMNSYKKLAKNTLWFSIGNFGSKTISFFMVRFYTDYLSKEEYGRLDLLTTTITLLVPILTLQISDAILRFALDKNEGNDKKEVLGNAVYMMVVGIILSLVLYPALSYFDLFTEYTKYFYLVLWLTMSSSVFKFYLRSEDKVKLAAISDISYTIIFVILNIILVAGFNMGLKGYFISMVIGYILMNLILIIGGKIYMEVGRRNGKLMKKMLKYSIPMVPNSISWWIMNASDKYIILWFIGMQANGVYGAATKIPMIITTLNSVVTNSWQVSAIEEHSKENSDKFYTNIFKINFAFIMVLCSFLILIIKPVFKILVNPIYYEGWSYTPFLIMGVGIASFSSFFGVGYLTSKNTIGAFYTSVYGAAINIIINLFFIKKIGIQAATISTYISYLVMWIIRVYQTKPYFVVTLDYKNIIFSCILMLVQSIISVYVDNNISNILQVIIFIVIFFVNRKYFLIVANKVLNKFLKK